MHFPGHFELLIIGLLSLVFCVGPIAVIAVVVWYVRKTGEADRKS